MQHKHILDPQFQYVNAASTDIRKTFDRVRKELAIKKVVRSALSTEMYFPIPESVDEQEFAECMRLMHQDLDQNDVWGV